jgi:hypothetical protein
LAVTTTIVEQSLPGSKKVFGHFQQLEEMMSSWMYRFLIVGLTFFSTAPLSQPDKDDQPGVLNVHIRDYCDPVTFAAIGCVRTVTPVSSGVITFSGFNAELGADKSVGAWRFVPDRANADEGLGLMLQNLGGETHTFTRVREFGGGFVAPLNAASGNPVPAPECAQTVNGQLVPQPPSPDNIFLDGNASATGPLVPERETAKFQCCIHPWMRMTVNAKKDKTQNEGHDR